MSKKNIEVKSVPEIYKDLIKDPSTLKLCIVEDVHGQFFGYQTPEKNNIVRQAIAKIWPNHDAFHAQGMPTILTYHANLFGDEPPKGQVEMVTSTNCWFKLIMTLTNKDALNVNLTPRAESGRRSTILNSTYFYGDINEGTGSLKTPQAMACLKIFRETIKAKQDADAKIAEEKSIPLPKDYVPSITELELQQAINARATELHTRQDPWRIFQYYRKDLISGGFLRRQ